VETSTIAKGDIENGGVVTTASGSRYFLTDKTVREMRQESNKSAPVSMEATTAKPRATLQLTKQTKERGAKAAQAALEKAAAPRTTFSLTALLGLDKEDKTKPKKSVISQAKPSISPVVEKAPKGVPSIGRWKQNRDKSITGFITGAPAFDDGERVTTSPIAQGTIGAGEVVVTSSGTQYFLQ
jgi:hypothetical protein